ncbi:Putative polyketide biosynthesis enoyl-CoA isomerase PksI [Streptomyces avidinii]
MTTPTGSRPRNTPSVPHATPREFGPVTLVQAGAVAEIRMTDAAHRNSIQDPMCAGMGDAIVAAVADPRTHVILLLGLEDTFCSGHARDWLLGADQGAGQREDFVPAVDFIRTAIDCPLPVVAAMQGSAAGGGLLLGLYADLAVLSRRSVYATTFMTYGFTPGLGSTALLPTRLGPDLGTEMLLTGRGYTGGELQARGAHVTVTAHDAVEDAARTMAQRVARAPRRSLEGLKALLTDALKARTAAALLRETPLQSETVALPHVQELIANFYPEPGQGSSP